MVFDFFLKQKTAYEMRISDWSSDVCSSDLREEMVARGSGLRGILRIGCVPGAVPELLAPTLSAYKQLHPRVAVSVIVDTSNVMIRQLARGEVDLVQIGRAHV